MKFRIASVDSVEHPTHTRFPFRYGIASMRDVQHLLLQIRLEFDDGATTGLAAEGLPPKWFTKDPDSDFADDLADMRRVIGHATEAAAAIAREPVDFFDFWSELMRRQQAWAASEGHPPLLAGLGVSLCERAVLDAICRHLKKPMHRVLQDGALGLRLGEVHPDLTSTDPLTLLEPQPSPSTHLRHTVGLTDPLFPADIVEDERADDGLPQDLRSCIREYGLQYFKIKLSGNAERDGERLRSIVQVLNEEAGDSWQTTLDGNENFSDFGSFRAFWEELTREPIFKSLLKRVIVVEQPVHRKHALSDGAGKVLREWPERPPLIIDESDGACDDLPRALELGYAGTSHKNCKGIVKGLANACLLSKRRRQELPGILTGEDLSNIGPVALLQDLAMMAILGVNHVERNGHHYFRGLSMWPGDWQREMLEAHGDLYVQHANGFPTLRIVEGRIALESINQAPFGCRPQLDPAKLQGPV